MAKNWMISPNQMKWIVVTYYHNRGNLIGNDYSLKCYNLSLKLIIVIVLSGENLE